MQVHLEAIKFNYDENLSRTGAFYIRRNETQTVRIPEWQPDGGGSHESSPVAYSMSNLPAMMTIQASFRSTGGPQTVLVRAQAESAGHVLGDVQQESIPGNGSSGLITFNMPGARAMVLQSGIGFYDIVWRWQFSQNAISWTTFQTTRHRIYAVLAQPQAPWRPRSALSSNIHQPWTEVLNNACAWAAGVKGHPLQVADEAARMITDRVNDLGATLLTHRSGAAYAHDKFDCTGFLELLKSGLGKQAVNCEDCATIVSTFSNILGCELWQSSMGDGFQTNHVLRVGDRIWAPTGFVQHTVAWKGACLEPDILFDSFLQLDGDERPDLPPPVALRASGTSFGFAQERFYRFRLVHRNSQCRPMPNDGRYPRQRRELGKSYRGAAKITGSPAIELLKRIYAFESWPEIENSSDQGHLNPGIFAQVLGHKFFPTWMVHAVDEFSDDQFHSVIQLIFRRFEPETSRFLAINVYECHGLEKVNNSFLQILGSFNQLTLTRLMVPRIGELAFTEEGPTTVVFRQGRFIGLVESCGRQPVHVEDIAIGLYDLLRSLPKVTEQRETSTDESPVRLSKEIQPKEQIMSEEIRTEQTPSRPHPLAHRWRTFTLRLSDPPTFVNRGILDLRTLTEDGVLKAGVIEPVQGTPQLIRGKVSEIGELTHIELIRDAYGTYNGFVTHVDTQKSEIVISGRLTYDANLKILDDGTPRLREQQQEPWVITKP